MKKYFWLGVCAPFVSLLLGACVLVDHSPLVLGIAFSLLAVGIGFLSFKLYQFFLNDPQTPLETLTVAPGVQDFFHGLALGGLFLIVLLFVVPAVLLYLDAKGLMPAGW